MVNVSSENLVEAAQKKDRSLLHSAAFVDYGFAPGPHSNKSEEELQTIFVMWCDLINDKGVDARDLHMALLGNDLNGLVARKNVDAPSPAYLKMQERGWKIETPYDSWPTEEDSEDDKEEDSDADVIGSCDHDSD